MRASDEQLASIYDSVGPEMPASPAGLRAVQSYVTTELLREIEAIEETRPEMREHSVIPHITEIDLGAAHERDRQIAWFVAGQICEVLSVEFAQAAEKCCDGKLTIEAVQEVLSKINVCGAPVTEALPDHAHP